MKPTTTAYYTYDKTGILKHNVKEGSAIATITGLKNDVTVTPAVEDATYGSISGLTTEEVVDENGNTTTQIKLTAALIPTTGTNPTVKVSGNGYVLDLGMTTAGRLRRSVTPNAPNLKLRQVPQVTCFPLTRRALLTKQQSRMIQLY